MGEALDVPHAPERLSQGNGAAEERAGNLSLERLWRRPKVVDHDLPARLHVAASQGHALANARDRPHLEAATHAPSVACGSCGGRLAPPPGRKLGLARHETLPGERFIPTGKGRDGVVAGIQGGRQGAKACSEWLNPVAVNAGSRVIQRARQRPSASTSDATRNRPPTWATSFSD